MSNRLSKNNSITWADIKRVLQPGMLIDVQFHEADMPLQYHVLMLLEEALIFCRSAEEVGLSALDGAVSAMVFIPTARDLCVFKVSIKQMAENGMYLALTPTTTPEFLRHRRSVRVKTHDDISYRVQFDGKSNIYKGIAVQDIGRGGIGLVVYAAGPIPEKSHAEVKVSFPKLNEQVSAQGVVSHCIPYGSMPRTYRVGIQFTKISPSHQQAIAMYIESAAKATRR